MLTNEQKVERRQALGASEVAAALGIDPHRSPLELYCEKAGIIDRGEAESEAIKLGHGLEAALVSMLTDSLVEHGVGGGEVVELTPEYRIGGTPIVAHPDAVAYDGDLKAMHLREIKTSRLTNSWQRLDDFGAEWTDEIPPHWAVQAYVNLEAAGLEDMYLGALVGGLGFRVYHLRNRGIGAELVKRATEWWNRHVVAGVEPDITNAVRDIKALRRKPRVVKTVEVPHELIRTAREACDVCREAEAAKAAALAALVQAMGDATEATDGNDDRGAELRYVLKTSKRRTIDTAELRRLYPDMAEAVTKETEVTSGRWIDPPSCE